MRYLFLIGVCIAAIWLVNSPSAEDVLDDCVYSTEQVRLLQKIALDGKQKQMFVFCLETFHDSELCEGQYLNAELQVRNCMKKSGFTFIFGNKCSYVNWRSNPQCYQPNWLAKLNSLVEKKK